MVGEAIEVRCSEFVQQQSNLVFARCWGGCLLRTAHNRFYGCVIELLCVQTVQASNHRRQALRVCSRQLLHSQGSCAWINLPQHDNRILTRSINSTNYIIHTHQHTLVRIDLPSPTHEAAKFPSKPDATQLQTVGNKHLQAFITFAGGERGPHRNTGIVGGWISAVRAASLHRCSSSPNQQQCDMATMTAVAAPVHPTYDIKQVRLRCMSWGSVHGLHWDDVCWCSRGLRLWWLPSTHPPTHPLTCPAPASSGHQSSTGRGCWGPR